MNTSAQATDSLCNVNVSIDDLPDTEDDSALSTS